MNSESRLSLTNDLIHDVIESKFCKHSSFAISALGICPIRRILPNLSPTANVFWWLEILNSDYLELKKM
jgi:hypothetical protein